MFRFLCIFGEVIIMLFSTKGFSKSSPKNVDIILGTMAFGGQVSQEDATLQIKAFFEHGFCKVDTARMYCHGKTEIVLGNIFANQRQSLPSLSACEIASKVNPFKGYNENLSSENGNAHDLINYNFVILRLPFWTS